MSSRVAAAATPAVSGAWLVVIALLAGLLAAGLRVPLLWDDAWPPGYDGWFYVLQVRSTLAGAPLFEDASLVYPLLAGLGWLLGDVIVGNKVGVCLFAGLGAAGAAVGGARWTGSVAAGLAAGLWWAAAPGHLFVSTEFVKNEAGLAVLGGLLAVLPGCERGWPRWGSAVVLAGLGLLVHKLTGAIGVGLLVGYGGLVALRGRVSWWVLLVGAGALGLLLVFGLGVLRLVDLQRFFEGHAGGSDRWTLLLTSPRLSRAHRLTLGLAHVAPLLLGLSLLGVAGRPLRPLGLPLAGLAAGLTAIYLPFGFDLTAWRLLLLTFVPAAFLAAAAVARVGPVLDGLLRARLPRVPSTGEPVLAGLLAASILLPLPWTIPHQTRPEPDYQAWSTVIPTLRAHVPPGARVVAHRGLCGFVYGAADLPCENFEPPTAEGWWRIAYAASVEDLRAFSEVEPVPLRPAYVLVPESAWRRYRSAFEGRNPYARHPMNPHRPRPGFVYGPRRGPQVPATPRGATHPPTRRPPPRASRPPSPP